ncbi:MAG: hypothetical protein DRR16_15625 [Candidatus Parabeggiatoa sp. nov. 3]|nr:MAG: hypothetical protein DRR00_25400 [Gammaproteobacteria bacterium]RKZ54401.1 MAG: hypothetical protein DRQ99_31225 [Gammaproteobacteria bacterium]RKZ84116.1 MAG: hypothetical protein DRR16_15625 [Gammaproteobacteria bacterium]
MNKNQINRHVILTSGRSGSNYLANVLNWHPNVVNYGEVLTKTIIPYKWYMKCKICPWSVTEYLEAFYSSRTLFYAAQFYSVYSHIRTGKPINLKRRKNVKSIGTKDFFLHYQLTKAENFLISNKDIAIIYLYRENLLRRYLSMIFLNKTRVAKTEKKQTVQKVSIDIDHMIGYLKILETERENENRILAVLQDHPLLAVKYEDYLLADQQATVIDYNKRIFEFLGVEPIEILSNHQKILPQEMCKIIQNYDEFRACLINTQYEHYLD